MPRKFAGGSSFLIFKNDLVILRFFPPKKISAVKFGLVSYFKGILATPPKATPPQE